MTLFKPSDADLTELKKAAALLKEANKFFAIAKKNSDAAKKKLAEWLKAERKLDLETLKIGEMVQIEDVCLVEIRSQNRFDEGSFLLNEPELHAEYKKDFPTKYFKPLV